MVILWFPLIATGQDYPKAEVYTGYSYLRGDFDANFNGWNASVSANLNNWFGVVGDSSGHYLGNGASLHLFLYGLAFRRQIIGSDQASLKGAKTMLRKSLAMLLAALLFQMLCVESASAKTDEEKRAQLAEKVKSGILKLGVGRDSRVEVKMYDRTKLAGYVSEVKADSFAITDPKTEAATSVAYTDVSGVKGHNLSTGAKIGIGIGIGVALVFIVLGIMSATGKIG
jgi:hypothetical protein